MNMAGGGLVRNYQDGGEVALRRRLEDLSLSDEERIRIVREIRALSVAPEDIEEDEAHFKSYGLDPDVELLKAFGFSPRPQSSPAQGPTGGLSGLVSQLGAAGAGAAPPPPSPQGHQYPMGVMADDPNAFPNNPPVNLNPPARMGRGDWRPQSQQAPNMSGAQRLSGLRSIPQTLSPAFSGIDMNNLPAPPTTVPSDVARLQQAGPFPLSAPPGTEAVAIQRAGEFLSPGELQAAGQAWPDAPRQQRGQPPGGPMSVDPLAGFAAANPNLMRGDAPPPTPPPTPRPPVQVDPVFDFNARYNENLAGLGDDPRIAEMDAIRAEMAKRNAPNADAVKLALAQGFIGAPSVAIGAQQAFGNAAPFLQELSLATSRQEGQSLRDQLSSLERMSASESGRRREARDMTRDERAAFAQDRAFEQGKKEFNALMRVEDKKIINAHNKMIQNRFEFGTEQFNKLKTSAMKAAVDSVESGMFDNENDRRNAIMEAYFEAMSVLTGSIGDSRERTL